MRTSLLTTLLTCGLAAGCVQRTITVTSEPAGAMVQLNDEEIGRTPVTVPFLFYGVYDVQLKKDGFETIQGPARASQPWWDNIPIDLVMELVPNAKSEIKWHYELDPKQPSDPAGLIQRANELRKQLPEN